MWLFFITTLALCGCAKETVSRVPSDITRGAIREQLTREPIPFPEKSPFDAEGSQGKAYHAGYTKGWTTVLELWLGNAITTPTEYQHDGSLHEAWRQGCKDGQNAAYNAVTSRARSVNKAEDERRR